MAGKGTPAIVAAEKAGIAFSVHEYAHDPAAPSYGLEAAEKLAADPARVFKTLVVDVAGGISPLGQRRALPTVIDESAFDFTTVHVSAGRRGLQIELVAADLAALTCGRVLRIAKARETG